MNHILQLVSTVNLMFPNNIDSLFRFLTRSSVVRGDIWKEELKNKSTPLLLSRLSVPGCSVHTMPSLHVVMGVRVPSPGFLKGQLAPPISIPVQSQLDKDYIYWPFPILHCSFSLCLAWNCVWIAGSMLLTFGFVFGCSLIELHLPRSSACHLTLAQGIPT